MLSPPDAPGQQFYHAPPSRPGRYAASGAVLLGGGLLLYYWLRGPHPVGAHVGFGVAAGLLGWLLYAALARRPGACLTLGPQQVSLAYGSRTTTLPYRDLRGFREKYVRGEGSLTLLEPLDAARPGIRLTRQLADYDRIRELLAAQVPDLDAPERQRQQRVHARTTSALLQNPALGPTPNARQATLDRAEKTVAGLTLAAVPLGLWLLIGWPYELVTPLGLAVPLLALGALWRHRGVVSFASGQGDPRPDVLPALGLPCVPLLLYAVARTSFVSWQPLWPVAGSILAGFALLLLAGSGRGTGPCESPLKQVGLAVLLAAGYGLAAAVFYNNAFGGGRPPTRYLARIGVKYRTTGKGSHYYLHLGAGGPAGAPGRVAVSRDYYAQKPVGDTITLRLYRGRLGATWVQVPADE